MPFQNAAIRFGAHPAGLPACWLLQSGHPTGTVPDLRDLLWPPALQAPRLTPAPLCTMAPQFAFANTGRVVSLTVINNLPWASDYDISEWCLLGIGCQRWRWLVQRAGGDPLCKAWLPPMACGGWTTCNRARLPCQPCPPPLLPPTCLEQTTPSCYSEWQVIDPCEPLHVWYKCIACCCDVTKTRCTTCRLP